MCGIYIYYSIGIFGSWNSCSVRKSRLCCYDLRFSIDNFPSTAKTPALFLDNGIMTCPNSTLLLISLFNTVTVPLLVCPNSKAPLEKSPFNRFLSLFTISPETRVNTKSADA